MKAYKGTNKNMVCRGFQYELGKEYIHEGDEIKLCKSGFHACLKPIDCLNYYSYNGENRFFEVEIDGVSEERIGVDSKVVAKSIKFIKELTDLSELLEGAEYIPSSAFFSRSKLASITIPHSVTTIDNWAFDGCKSLTSVTIPDSVLDIGDYAFAGCSSLTSIDVPDSVTKIGFGAFTACTSLTNVTIGNSVTSISSFVFYECSNLKSITYNGTIAQWSAIIKSINWKYRVPSSCMIHCTDGDINI